MRRLAWGLVLCTGCTRPVDSGVCLTAAVDAVAPDEGMVSLPTVRGSSTRLWELDARFAGPQRTPDPSQTWSRAQVREWHTVDAMGARYVSPVVLEYPTPEALRLTIRPHGSVWVDVLAATAQVPTPEDRMMRVQRVGLPRDAGETVVVDVPIASTLYENWRDEQRPAGLARFEVQFAEGSEAELVAVQWLERRQDAGLAPVVADSLDVDGVRRPGWALHPGGSVQVSIRDVGPGAEWTAWLAGQPSARLTLSIDGAEVGRWTPSSSWERVAVALPEGTTSARALALTNDGGGLVQVGAPRVQGPAEPATNLLIYLVDTLRADHVGIASTEPSVTPTLDRLAQEGVWFAQAQSTGSWTKPVIPTVLTGQWPMQHGVGLFSIADRLHPSTQTLQGVLGRSGYRVGSFSASPLGSTLSGLERDFDVAVPPVHWTGRLGALGHPSATQVHDALLDWIDSAPERPWAAYVHTLEPHAWAEEPYAHAADTPYRAAVADMDTQLQALVDALRARDMLDETLIVFLSDHGESFGGNGYRGHGTALVQAQTHVPLLFWRPGSLPASVVTSPVSLADVAPTVVDLLDLPALVHVDGTSVVPAMRGESVLSRSGVPAARMRFVQRSDDPALFSWVSADGMKVVRRADETTQWDLSSDPCEQLPIAVDDVHVDALQAWGQEQQAGWATPWTQDLNASDAALLTALGYLEE